MPQEKQELRRRAGKTVWIHLGASGVLQPLSQEFLYRSPAAPAAYACRRWVTPFGGQDHAAV